MMNVGTNIKQRDIIFVPFPYSDLSSSKQRPALVLSGKDYISKNNNVICCALTSSTENFHRGVLLNNKDLDLGHLDFETAVIPCQVFTPHKNTIKKTIGRLNVETSKKVVDFLEIKIKIEE